MAEFVRFPARVVSLVPSLTETVFALTAGPLLVGRTRWCNLPSEATQVEVVGGTKDPDLDVILRLAPDLVLANREENRKEDVEQLERFTRVLVTDTRSPRDAADLILQLGAELAAQPAAQVIAEQIHAAMNAVAAGPGNGADDVGRPRMAYLIWREPWMTVTSETYIGALLESAGFENVFGRLPGRYPVISAMDLRHARPDLILLPDEPFRFVEGHRQQLLREDVSSRVELVPGAPFSWFCAQTAGGLRLAAEMCRRTRATR